MNQSHPVKVHQLEPSWEFHSPEDPFDTFSVDDGRVYVLCRSRIAMFPVDTSDQPRYLPLDHPPVGTPASFTTQDIVFACESLGVVRADRNLTAAPQFLWKGGDGSTNAVISEGWLYCTCWDDQHEDLARLSPTNPGTGWGISTGGGIGSPATVADGRVYVGMTNGGVAAFDAVNGDPIWDFPEPLRVSDTGTCVVENGVLYVATEVVHPTHLDGWIYALDILAHGARLWKTILDRQSRTFLTLYGEFVYCASLTTLYALRRDNGEVHATRPGLPGVCYPSHVVPWGNRLYLAAGDCVIEVDPGSFTEIQRHQFPGGAVQRFLIENSILYVSTGDPEVGGQHLAAYPL